VSKDKFTLFLEQSKFVSPILNSATLDQVFIDANKKTWEFSITLSDCVEPEVLLPFITNLKSYFYVSRVLTSILVKFNYISLTSFEKYAMSYFDYAVIELSKEKARYLVLKNFKARYEKGTYILSIDQDSTYIQEYFKDVETVFQSFGLPAKFKLEVIHTLKARVCEKDN